MEGKSSGKMFDTKSIEVTETYSNLSQEVVTITTDKLKIIHTEYLSDIERRREWIAPLGIIISIILIFVTADFKDAVFKASTWEAFFLMSAILTAIWFVKSIYRSIKSKSVDDLMNIIKNNPN